MRANPRSDERATHVIAGATGRARAAKPPTQRESPQPALPIAQIRGRNETRGEYFECPRCGVRYQTLADFRQQGVRTMTLRRRREPSPVTDVWIDQRPSGVYTLALEGMTFTTPHAERVVDLLTDHAGLLAIHRGTLHPKDER